MTCVDPKEAEDLLLSGDTTSARFRSHASRCPECAELYRAVVGLARGGAAHPEGSALVQFEEDPESLSDGTRAWIAKHLADCAECSELLQRVPPLGLPLAKKRFSIAPMLAAAGWVLAAVLALRELREGDLTRKAILDSQTITLSQTRGEGTERLKDVDVIRFECVMGEDVKVGQKLHVRIEDAGGKALVETDAVVDELTQFGWPVIGINRSVLPKGKMTVRVRAPSGSEITAALDG